ncbi:uncharacterized protein [Medicago truncatula]|uniref:uncharacterized protein n=1 Tax=Medicago truncatula TaxID=3880 RepID=UPI000D2F3265|nr:uncharacterized protein LOC112417337 [Medicago truncatula]
MSDKSTTKSMIASPCANCEGSKKVREAKALMKSYVASDHVSKILRSLPARWRPKKEKSKDKSKKSNFNTRKFRKQSKKSLMETWEDLDSDSNSEKEEAEEDDKVVVGLVATVTSEADSDSDSKDENERLQEKCNGKSLSKEEISLEEYIMSSIDRSKVASMIYSINRNNDKGIGFLEGKPNEISLKACCECTKEVLKTFSILEGAKSETVVQSEPEATSSEAKITSKPKNSKPKAMIKSDSKTSKIKIMKRSEPVPQSLLRPEAGILKSKF